MDIWEAIEKRHSYRGGFSDSPVPRSDLEKIVKAGLKAPSGKNAQTTQFIIVDDRELLRQIGSLHTMPAMNQARAMIVCVVDRDPGPVYEGYSFQTEDCSAATENMLLAITALGYSSVWIDGWLRLEQRAEKIGRLLGLPGHKLVKVLLPLGFPCKKGKIPEKFPFTSRAWFNRYRG